MKLSPEQWKKVLVIIMMLIGAVYVIWDFVITASFAKIAANTAKQEKVKKDLDAATKLIALVKQGEVKQTEQEAELQYFEKMMPTIVPTAFYPTKINEVFNPDSKLKMTMPVVTSVDPKLKDVGENYVRLGWYLTISDVSYHEVGKLMARVENAEPLWEFFSIEIRRPSDPSGTADPQRHTAQIIIATIDDK